MSHNFLLRHTDSNPGEVDAWEKEISGVLPQDILRGLPADFDQRWPELSEAALLRHMRDLAGSNQSLRSLAGQGYYGTHTPSVLLRNFFENPGWYTAYTPYQAEISQGRLELLLNFQTMICDLTGMEVANASLLDEATAAAEAVAMMFRVREDRNLKGVFLHESVFARTVEVIRTRSEPLGIEAISGSEQEFRRAGHRLFAAVWQSPGSDGVVRDFSSLIKEVPAVRHILGSDLLALMLMESPASMGVQVVYGNTQRLGVPLGYGGPHAAFFATTGEFTRSMPGRIIGVSRDRYGRPAYRMALQTREQHIRRETATSNICTAQALLAMLAGLYAAWHGPDGLREIAHRIHRFACRFAAGLRESGFIMPEGNIFDTVLFRHANLSDSEIESKLNQAGFSVSRHDSGISISFDELTDEMEFRNLCRCLSVPEDADVTVCLYSEREVLKAPVFRSLYSETRMMRYLKFLENKDLALNRAMIPLGSCTMKLNPAAAMMPVGFPGFADIHPAELPERLPGYQFVIRELKDILGVITGLPAVTLQPNSGAQGELTGLLIIRSYFRKRGEFSRNIAIIPSSAHGTNPASAVMAGFKVMVVGCNADGNIDPDDLHRKIAEAGSDLGVLMITYPSTHGVYEPKIRDLTSAIHKAGGLVYMDGANMNAQVGLMSPAAIGADVCHINLHKTFAIPHGGGGPGMGPVCAAEFLRDYLPHEFPVQATGRAGDTIAVSGAPYGSASILLVSYAYIRMLGAPGLKRATVAAVYKANYILHRLSDDYPVLYRGSGGGVAHELILDLRPFRQCGVEVEDVAKRLMDFSFHAPTMSFPVAGTLMIEPTESEDFAEIDRFITAMKTIRKEIAFLEQHPDKAAESPLKNAPHTLEMVVAGEWPYVYSREEAAFPEGSLPAVSKYWPAVARIDNAFGDRNLVCTCAPIEEYAM